MAKLTSLILLLVVAISWSDASLAKRAISKRSTEEVVTEDMIEESIAKELFAEILLLGAKPDEKPIMEKRFQDAVMLYGANDSVEEYAKKLLEIFEQVTGRTFSLNSSVFIDSDSSAVSLEKTKLDSPPARVIQQRG